MNINRLFYTLALSSCLTLNGCLESESSDTTVNYTGSTAQASVDASTSAGLAKATIYAVLTSEGSETLLSAIGSADPCTTGGSMSPGLTLDGIDFTFSNCDLGTGKVLNGVVGVTGDVAGSFSAQFTNFTLTDSNTNNVETIENLSITCTGGTAGSCSVAADFTGPNGLIYRIRNIMLSKDVSGNFDISGRVYHPTHGYADIVTNNIALISFGACANGDTPDAGEVTLTGAAGSSAIITYTCSNISINTAGATTTVNW